MRELETETRDFPTACLFMCSYIYVQHSLTLLHTHTHPLFHTASDRLGVVNVSGGSSPSSGPLLTISSRLESGRAGVTSDPSQSTKREGGKNKKELVRPAERLPHPSRCVFICRRDFNIE